MWNLYMDRKGDRRMEMSRCGCFAGPIYYVRPQTLHIERASRHRQMLEALVAATTAHTTTLLFVDDIAEWGRQTGAKVSGNPNATALKGSSDQPWLIVLRENMDAARVTSNLDAMDIFESHANVVQLLSTPERFLQHTVLHELGHLVLGCGNEGEEQCNRWAFSHLPVDAQ